MTAETKEKIRREAEQHIRQAEAHIVRQIEILTGLCRLGSPALHGILAQAVVGALVDHRLSLDMLRRGARAQGFQLHSPRLLDTPSPETPCSPLVQRI